MSVLEEFLSDAFPPQGNVYVCSIINDRGGQEKHVATTDPAHIRSFVARWDVHGRGCYYCVSTIRGSRRAKAAARATLMVHADIDLKDLDATAEHVLGVLEGLEKPPSRVHHSGHGLHALWLLDHPAAPDDRLEALLRRVARAVGGDESVAQVASLMRMPGTHNSKNDEWREVRVIRRTDQRYSLEELEGWSWRPVLLRRSAVPLNPFLQVAEDQGFRPAMDVDARLAAMEYRGGGDTSIHNTQLSCMASLLSAGMTKVDAVAKILAATRAAVGNVPWRWDREELGLVEMADSWIRKHGASTDRRREATGGTVVSLADAKKKAPKADGKKAHIVLARGVLEEMRQRGESILFVGSQMWLYQGMRWRPISAAEERDLIDRAVERGCQILGIVSKNTLVNETRGWIRRQPDLYAQSVAWDDHGKVSTRGGLLDLTTMRVEEHRPEHRTTRWLDCEFLPEAECPWWLRMLQDTFDPAVVSLVQEVAGSFLVENRSRALRRALVFFGASNTGKSSMIATLSGFFSRGVNTTPLEMLENAHGLMSFLQSEPWVLHEAFEQGRWQFSAHAKALLSADPINVNVKNGPLVAHTFRQPILWGTNSPPQFRESTKAMQNRLITVPCLREFGAEPVGAAVEATARGFSSPAEMVLSRERSGILNWAIQGWKRLSERGSFALPDDVGEAMHEMWLQSNLVAGFVEDCAELDAGAMVATPDFCGAFRVWWEENRGDQKAPSSQAIGTALKALGDVRISTKSSLRDRMWRYYGGLKLNEKGLDMWQGYAASRSASDSGARISGSAPEVNRRMPQEWRGA